MGKIRKIMSIFIVSGLLIAGCSKESSSASKDYGLKNVTFPLKEKVTLKFMIQSSPLAPKDPNDKLIFKRLEKKTNVHIEWTNYTNGNYSPQC
ncbi:hypothetical protein [Parageobacillus toebii]|uniref:hypothetical protein n=1 Tax=Parageobacillus toebii TaxID=153151 RepID=UPI00078937F4|nr:hypothetical protein [Parageobacillus toebii]